MTDYPHIHYLKRLQDATRKYWDKPALNDVGGESYTFGQMALTVEKLHCFFDAAGIRKGDHIAISAANGSHWGMAYVSVITAETVVVPILNDFLPDNVAFLTAHSDSVGLFTNAEKWNKMDAGDIPGLRFVIDVDDWTLLYAADEAVRKAYENRDAVFAERHPGGYKAEDVVFPETPPDDLAMINYTSGSTGNPKGVMLTNRNFTATVDYCQYKMPVGDAMVSMLPMAHMYGLMIEFVYPVCNGTSIYWLGKAPTPAALMKAFSEVHPYLLISVPLVMEKIFKGKIKPTLDKPAVKFLSKVPGLNQIVFKKVREGLLTAFGGNVREFIFGGAPFNPEVEKWLKRIKFPYCVGYGMTEANPLLAYEYARLYKMGSCGRPVDCTTVRIDSEDPQNVVGEIQAKGDNICIGYYKNEEATRNAFTPDGYLRTGDLGIMDSDGFIFIKGRSKFMILSANGQNIYPEEVEAVVNNQSYVAESVVVDRGGKLVALVYLDQKAMEKAGLGEGDVAGVLENIRVAANHKLPVYSKIMKVENRTEPFEKTPKMSIKRFLYR